MFLYFRFDLGRAVAPIVVGILAWLVFSFAPFFYLLSQRYITRRNTHRRAQRHTCAPPLGSLVRTLPRRHHTMTARCVQVPDAAQQCADATVQHGPHRDEHTRDARRVGPATGEP